MPPHGCPSFGWAPDLRNCPGDGYSRVFHRANHREDPPDGCMIEFGKPSTLSRGSGTPTRAPVDLDSTHALNG